jgi:hypothetical protein
VRLSYAVSDDDLEKALDRILGLIHRLGAASSSVMTAS